MPKFNSTLERFMSHVRILPNGCWEWTGSLENGYGRFNIDGNPVRMPRAAWLIQKGAISEGLEPDHLCRYRPCVNCDHMELVTHAENVRRGEAGKLQRERTHCPKGHPYDGENLSIKTTGARRCMACERAYCERKRRIEGARVRSETHCYRGHSFDVPNTIFRKHKDGRVQRVCRECQRAAGRRSDAKSRSERINSLLPSQI